MSELERLKRNAAMRAYRKAHPDRIKRTAKKAWLKRRDTVDKAVLRETRRRWHLKTKYGITSEEFHRMLQAQNGVCKVCRQPETGIRRGACKSLDVDHNHETGVVRDLLCSACNAALGILKEDALRIRALASYIERHNAK